MGLPVFPVPTVAAAFSTDDDIAYGERHGRQQNPKEASVIRVFCSEHRVPQGRQLPCDFERENISPTNSGFDKCQGRARKKYVSSIDFRSSNKFCIIIKKRSRIICYNLCFNQIGKIRIYLNGSR